VLEDNVASVLARIGSEGRVLDVGGWLRPFTRADWVVDLMPYETRAGAGRQGPPDERFTRDTWVQMEVRGGVPLPFEDDSFDFVICSHTLEDIRDPIFLCSELVRVGRAGYVETPSVQGIESRSYAGHSHHRWLVSADGQALVFRMKPHFIHGSWNYHLPAATGRTLSPARRVTWLFWEGTFGFEERIELDALEQRRWIEDLVRASGAYPEWRWRLLTPMERATALADRARVHARRVLTRR
jgi:SAM-dependent methyltransferase